MEFATAQQGIKDKSMDSETTSFEPCFEERPQSVFNQVRSETFGQPAKKDAPPGAEITDSAEKPCTHSLIRETSSVYLIPEKDALSGFNKAIQYAFGANMFGIALGYSAARTIPSLKFVAYLVGAGAGVVDAHYVIKGRELRSLQAKLSDEKSSQ